MRANAMLLIDLAFPDRIELGFASILTCSINANAVILNERLFPITVLEVPDMSMRAFFMITNTFVNPAVPSFQQ